MMNVLVTGAAGFIGYHLCRRLLDEGTSVFGIDNLNDYYDVNLKKSRLARLKDYEAFSFAAVDLADRKGLDIALSSKAFDRVVNLAAQPGVRYSLENPYTYIESNVVAFLNLLEYCRHSKSPHLVFASSSSVYGLNSKTPYSVHHNVDHPVSLYAATKKSNELMAHSYSHLYGLPVTGLRFFTVYGPWGRPDMAYYSFTKAILEGKPIKIFNRGDMERDFTYIDDIVEGVVRIMNVIPEPDLEWSSDSPDPGSSNAPYRIYNIGNNMPVRLMKFIETLENALGKKAIKEMMPMQPGDVYTTFADIDDLSRVAGFRPKTPLSTGLAVFVDWYRGYHKL